jgi:cell wall-associated NlpC family hydrolase
MMLIADQASAGIGVDWDNGKDDKGKRIESSFLSLAEQVRADRGDLITFGWKVSPHVVCVLGKQHTPHVGATFRSLSRYLGRATGLSRLICRSGKNTNGAAAGS